MANQVRPASEEDKNKLKEAFTKLWNALRSIFNKRSVVERMEKMQQEMDYMLAQNGMTEDAVKELTETFNTMSGRLHTLTPENVDAFVDELQQSIRIVAERNEESYTSPEFSDDFIKKIAHYVKADPSEAFAEDLMKNAQVVKIDGDNENAILSYKGHCMMARLDERQKQIVLIMSAIPPEQSVFTENGELAQGYSFAEIPEDMQGNAKLVLLNALCEQSDKTFVYDKEKEQRRILEEAKKKVSPQARFLGERYETAVQESDNLESIYKRDDATFRIRDKVTGEMLRIKSDKDKMQVFLSQDTQSFDVPKGSKEILLGQWEQKEKGILAGKFRLSLGSDNVTSMLRSDAVQKWFEMNGISLEAQNQSFHHRTDSKATWSKVDEAKMSNVIALQESCARSIAKNHPDEKIIASVYETTPKKKNHNKTYTFLNVVKDEGKGEENPKLSISFNSDGTPLTINYNNQFAYNIAARTTSENYHTVLWNDPAFRELYNIAVDALQEQGLDRGILKFGDVPYEKQETAKPESSYTAIYTAVPLGERGLTKQDMDSWIPLHEKNDAKIINQLALSAIRNGSISMKEIKQETKGHTIKTKQALDALVKLGVVSESLKHESLMSEEDYAKTISDLARNPQARAEFASLSNSDAGQNNFTTYLTDSYEDACQYDWNPYLVLNKTEYGLADVVMSAIETRLNNGHDSIDLAKLQRLTGKSSQEASNIMVELERMGIVEGENDKKILVSSDDIAHLKEVALQHEMSHDMGTLEYAEAITELVMETIEKGSISVDDIIINPSMAEKNVNASSAIHTLEELGVISGDDAHTCLVTQEEYAQKFKEGNSDAFTNLLAISYAEYTREEKADRDEFVTEKADSKEEISSPTEPEHDEIPEMPPFDEHDPYEDYPEQEDTAFAPNYPSDELPEDPYSGVEDNFHFENMPEPPEEPDMNNDLDMSLD